MIKCIYLAAKRHRLECFKSTVRYYYNDIEPFDGLDFVCDMLDVDLEPFDILIATPPCNYYSKANYRRETSVVAQATKHLLPSILDKFVKTGKPFLIENVCNWSIYPRFLKELVKANDIYVYTYGGHYFMSNIFAFGFNLPSPPCEHKAQKAYGHRDDNKAVDWFVNWWLCFILTGRNGYDLTHSCEFVPLLDREDCHD